MKNNKIQKNIPTGWQNVRLRNIAEYSADRMEVAKLTTNNYVGVDNILSGGSVSCSIYVPRSGRVCSYRAGDVLLSNIRPYLRKYWFAENEGGCSADVLVIRAKTDVVLPKFLYVNLSRDSFFDYEMAGAKGVKMPRGDKAQIMQYELGLPPLSEQKRIVSMLEGWDQAIEKMAKKIKIKKNIKKGLMQNLLTGRVRLAGFNDKWETFEVGELLNYEQPTKYIVKSTEYKDLHKIPVLTANKGFILGYTDETEGIYRDTPAIIFDDFTMDNKYVDFPFKVKSSAIKILKQKNSKINLRFVYEKMQLFNIVIGQHKRNYISEYQFLTMDVPSIKEQNAITNIIITADSEIKALEKRLTILKDQKKYLLNNLITGQIRTPENLSIKK